MVVAKCVDCGEMVMVRSARAVRGGRYTSDARGCPSCESQSKAAVGRMACAVSKVCGVSEGS